MSCEDTVRSKENNLGWYLKNSNENSIQGVKHGEILKFKESVSKKDLNKSLNEKTVKTGNRNKCIDILLGICLKAQTKKSPAMDEKM